MAPAAPNATNHFHSRRAPLRPELPRSNNAAYQQHPGQQVGMLHQVGIPEAGHLEVREELVGRPQQSRDEGDRHPPVVSHHPTDPHGPGHVHPGGVSLRSDLVLSRSRTQRAHGRCNAGFRQPFHP